MSHKKIWIGLVGGGLLLSVGLGGLIYMKHQDIEQARAEVASLRSSIASSRQLIQGTAKLEREVIVLRDTSDVINQILPSDADVKNLVRSFQRYADDAGVEMSSYKPKSDGRRGLTKSDFDRVAYTLNFEGDIFKFLDLVNSFETHKRFISAPSFHLSAASRRSIEEQGVAKHKIQLDIETYKYEPKGVLQPTRIEGYERKRDLLTGEINRRRQALQLSSFHYRGRRSRRDPWIDPRIEASTSTNVLAVQQQMELVEDLAERVTVAQGKWTEVQEAENVLSAMVARRDLIELIARLDEDLRRLEEDTLITFVPAQTRLKDGVYEPLETLRRGLDEGTHTLGPDRETLVQVQRAMERHLERGEYRLALEAFDTVRASLDMLEGDPLREELAQRLRRLAEDAEILIDFESIQIEIGGIAITEGVSKAVLIDGHAMGIGDIVRDELEVYDIRVGAIDFIYRGVILTRYF